MVANAYTGDHAFFVNIFLKIIKIRKQVKRPLRLWAVESNIEKAFVHIFHHEPVNPTGFFNEGPHRLKIAVGLQGGILDRSAHRAEGFTDH